MNKGTPSHMQEGDEFIKSKVPFGQAKEAVENVGLKPRVERGALSCGRGWCTVERQRSKKA